MEHTKLTKTHVLTIITSQIKKLALALSEAENLNTINDMANTSSTTDSKTFSLRMSLGTSFLCCLGCCLEVWRLISRK